ncbi:MAG: DUF3421 domain-containing protein [Polyangiaceae bacterium]
MDMKAVLSTTTTIAVALTCFGCTLDATQPGQDAESAASSEAALVPATWDAPPGNGVQTADGGRLGALTVCRASYDGGQHPGKVWQGLCHFGWGGKARTTSSYEVLRSNGYRWVNPLVQSCFGSICTSSAPLPNNAVDGGDAGIAAGHVRLGICEGYSTGDGTWHPGKYYKEKCNFAWSTKEIAQDPTIYDIVRVLVQ